MKFEFLDLGVQPIANNFLNAITEEHEEYFFRLVVTFDDETKLVSLRDLVSPELMFNDSYVYHSSMSKTMRDHFYDTAMKIQTDFSPSSVMEIGSNDGVFLRHFDPACTIAIEPCGNFAEKTNQLGYRTYSQFWNNSTSSMVLEEHGEQDVVFSANCMCHIGDLNEAFMSVRSVLSASGVFVFEDPSLLKMVERGSYDQIYDEHAHIFSVLALRNVLDKCGLDLFRVEEVSVHGGSNRIYACPKGSRDIEKSVSDCIAKEIEAGLHNLSTYQQFSTRVEQSREQLVDLLHELKRQGHKIVSYGATSKSTTIFNYCGITEDLIDYIVDTTPAKQGKLSPGVHIPVVSPEEGFDESVNYAFLGAWNFGNEIISKERSFLKRGRFISHVPYVRFVK